MPDMFEGCICPDVCDCQDPEPEEGGMAKVSNHCPEHNDGPIPCPECPAERHRGGQEWKWESDF